MARPLALALTLVAVLVAGCDSGGMQDDALVGTWTLTGSSVLDLVTVSEAQTVTDYARPPLSGSLTVTGAASATLAHVGTFQRTPGGASVLLQSVPRGQESEATVSVLLDAAGTGGLFAGNRFLPVTAFDGPAPFVLTPGELRVPGVRFADGQGEAAASGALTFATQSLAPGQEAALGRPRDQDLEPDYVVRYTFEPDGRLVLTETLGPDSQTTPGRWDVLGDGIVRLSLVEFGVRTTVRFAYRVEGGELRLVLYEEEPCSAECQRSVEGAYGIRTGTLSRFRTERAFVFARGGTPATGSPSPAARIAPSGPRHPLAAPAPGASPR